jgi:hypothetical protein
VFGVVTIRWTIYCKCRGEVADAPNTVLQSFTREIINNKYMKLGLWKSKLVENVGGAYNPVIFLQVLKDEDKDRCPHCNKPIPTEIVSVVSSPNHKEYYQEIVLPEQSTLSQLINPNNK